MAIRYDQKTKDEVVAFITKHNEENGRGGQSAAAAKWNLNPITVKSWMENAGVASPGKSSKKKKKVAGTAKRTGKAGKAETADTAAVAKKPVAAPRSVSAALKRMMAIQEQIGDLQSEYQSLKASL